MKMMAWLGLAPAKPSPPQTQSPIHVPSPPKAPNVVVDVREPEVISSRGRGRRTKKAINYSEKDSMFWDKCAEKVLGLTVRH